MAIMLITHDLGVVAEMATDVAVMYLGRVVEQAPVDEIFHAPRHPYTQALLRSIPRIRSSARERLTPIAGSVPHPYDRPSGCPFHPRCPDFMAGTLRPAGADPAAGRRSARRQLFPLRVTTARHRSCCGSPGCRSSFRSGRASGSGRWATFGRWTASTSTSTKGRRWDSSARAAAGRPPPRAASCAPSSRPAGEIFMRVADGCRGRDGQAAPVGAAGAAAGDADDLPGSIHLAQSRA